jgi:hypothetical protein
MNNSMRWDRNYAIVLSFAKEHGHLNLPYTNRDSRRLSIWLRRQKKRTQMPDCQKEKFGALMNLYELNQQSQEEREREAWDPIDDDKTLHTWILYQRQRAKQGRLLEERRKKLVEIDFKFACNSKRKETSFSAKQVTQWKTMYEQLAEYSRTHGDCMVPCIYEANLRLGQWVQKQRYDFTKKIMNLERKELLDQLGFAWNVEGNSRR